jgi:hypothetical protein
MNYTSKNTTAPQNINRLTAIGLPIRNIFTSVISLFLLSFFTVGVQAQHSIINTCLPVGKSNTQFSSIKILNLMTLPLRGDLEGLFSTEQVAAITIKNAEDIFGI